MSVCNIAFEPFEKDRFYDAIFSEKKVIYYLRINEAARKRYSKRGSQG